MKMTKKLIRKEIIKRSTFLTEYQVSINPSRHRHKELRKKIKKKKEETKHEAVLKLEHCFYTHEIAFSLKHFNYPDNKRKNSYSIILFL